MEETEAQALERWRMVDSQLRSRDITDRRVLATMGQVPRHRFVRPVDQPQAYADAPLPIGHRQTISQPYIVALMTQLVAPRPEDTVLEIGTGSGYQAAVLAALARRVISVERIPELAAQARRVLSELGIMNVEIIEGDGTHGHAAEAPYAGIVVTAGAPRLPDPLRDQLADGGRLVLPVGSRDGQMLERWTRRGGEVHRERIAPVAFVPLIGDQGWSEEAAGREGWSFGG
ncbi:MAG: protein-L-isoaspartate(D-aspartate) O-methyltransferase [Chloroflexi bacterium]|nr:protein-L-isoaspartate(D-aspartate) O-methyltransferase [Chloroflexota bacterium]